MFAQNIFLIFAYFVIYRYVHWFSWLYNLFWFPQHLCWGSPFLPSLSVSWSDCWNRAFPTPPRHQGLRLLLLLLCCTLLLNLFIGSYSYFALGPFFSSGTQLLLHNDIIYKKVIYNIGTEILIFTSNLRGAAHNAPISMIFSGVCTKFRALSF